MPSSSVIFMLCLVAVMIYLFLSEKISIDLTALLGVLVLTLCGFITPKEAFIGFSSPAVVTLASMFVIGAGLSVTGACDIAARYIGSLTGKHEVVNVLVIMLMAALLSAFMNNVAATAVLLPAVSSLATHNNLSPSRLFIPLSFATVLGGTCTMIGTSPNILIADVAREMNVAHIGIFDFSLLGICMAVPGIIFMTLFGRKLLPVRELNKRAKASSADLSSLYRLYERMFSLRVPEGSSIVGKAIAETNFRQVLNVQLLAMDRNGEKILNPPPHTIIEEQDVLIVQGRASRFEALLSLRGLDIGMPNEVPLEMQNFATTASRYEVLDGELADKNLRQLSLRETYDVVVLGIERDGQAFFRNVANKKLRVGDVLYMLGGSENLIAMESKGLVKPFVEPISAEVAQVHPIVVTKGAACIGQQVRETRLGELLGIRVFGVLRGSQVELVYDGQQTIEEGDRLLVVGAPSSIEALGELACLEIDSEQFNSSIESKEVGLVEVVLSPRSALIGKTPVQANFREKYGFQVLAVWREGRPYRSQLGSKVLQFGDALLLHGRRKNLSLILDEDDLVVLTETTPPSKKKSHAWYSVGALVLMVALSISRVVPVHFASFVGALAVIVTGTLKMEDAYRYINWRILVLVAAVLPLAPAMQSSGTNEFLSNVLINGIGDMGPLGLLIIVCILASLLSQALDAVVPIVLLAPIVMQAAGRLEVEPLPFLMGISFAASIAFLTPFSHKANLLVMAAGGYRIKDYFRVGILLTVICFIVLIVALPVIFPFKP